MRWAESTATARFGADRAGAPRRSAEAIGRFVAARFLEDVNSGGTVDRFAADQLVPFAALAAGTSRWRAPFVSEHLSANLWRAERFGAGVRCENAEIEITGLGACPRT